MRTFSHDYEIVEKVERLLTESAKNLIKGIKNEGYINVAKDQINIALYNLREYLTEPNCKWDKDGLYIKIYDTFTEDQLCQIRDEFSGIIGQTDNANNELDIINVCQHLLGNPEYKDYDQFKRDTSNTWTEITENDPEQ